MSARPLDLPLSFRLWRGVTHIAKPLLGAHLRSRVRKGKEDANRLSERDGIATRARPAGRLIWIHAASVGESLSVLPLINELLAARDDLSVLVTTGTVTSATLLEGKLPERAMHQYVPLDRVSAVRRFLDHWQPDAGLWVESELWPSLILESHARNIPLALINARLSEKSARGWARAPKAAAAMLSAFEVALAQDEGTAARLAELGAKKVRKLANLKLAAEPLPVDEDELDILRAALGDRPVWCAASTHDEEAIIAEAHKLIAARLPGSLTILAPRQPQRAESITHDLMLAGITVARRSGADPITPDTDIYLVDTIGDMGLVFRLAPVSFMGRSLIPMGGSNPLEPTQLGSAVLHGPHIENFGEIYADLQARGGTTKITDAASLAGAVVHLLSDAGAKGHQVAQALTLVSEAREVLSETRQVALNLLDGHATA